jgi:5-methylcytosine-specific restriction endonuclease McrA
VTEAIAALHVCKWCFAVYVPKRRDQTTCSPSCRRKNNNAEQNAKHKVHLDPRECADCGRAFQPVRRDSWTCSNRCWARARWIRSQHYRLCPGCGRGFIAGRSDRRTCSNRCSLRIYRNAHPGDHRIRAAAYEKRRAEWIAQHAGRISGTDWRRQLARQRGRCYYCDAQTLRLQMDHVVPISRGGHHRIGNVVGACPDCNNRKGSRYLSEWRYRHLGGVTWQQGLTLTQAMRGSSTTTGRRVRASPSGRPHLTRTPNLSTT